MKAEKDPAPWVITANDIRSGKVVYFDGSDISPQLSEAKIYRDKGELVEDMRGVAARDDVLDVFFFGVIVESDSVRVRRLRERIRSNGPTVQFFGEGGEAGEVNVSI